MKNVFEQYKMEMAVQEFKEASKVFPDICEVASSQLFTYYNELERAGFSEEQAFELIKAHGANPGKLFNLGGE